MNILMLHNRYLQRGGEDESTDTETALLRARGHTVDLHEMNNEIIARQGALRTGLETVWSQKAYRNIRAVLRQKKYDVVHIQNFFPLFSPSVHYAVQAEKVPLVQALRNYRLLCLNGVFYRDDRPCEDCVGPALPIPGISHACYRGTRLGSTAVAAMLVTHRMLRTWQRQVDCFYTLSDFARGKLVAGGLPAEKMVVKPNFIFPDPGLDVSEREFVFWVGRLVNEKGILTVLAAWDQLDVHIPLKIAGDGPLAEQVRAAAQRSPWIHYMGNQPMTEIYQLMGRAHFTLFPSLWYETFGRVIIESYAKSTPVIVSNIGAGASLIRENETGLLFRPGDSADLAAKVQWAWDHPKEMAAMGRNARLEYEAKYTAERNYEMLMAIYERAIAAHRKRQ